MFYEQSPDKALRLGDVVTGFVLGAASLRSPAEKHTDFLINVNYPQFAAVLTPCCSVGRQTIALAPLEKINPRWLLNPYLAEDLTRMNSPMEPEQSVAPAVWDKFSDEDKGQRLAKGKAYAFGELFVYAEHPLFPSYDIKVGEEAKNSGFYVLDFRSIHRVECKDIVNTKQVPLHAKLLQLSIPARSDLRDKLSAYFSRVPAEDLA